MDRLKPKKFLGQHFLNDRNIAGKIADALTGYGSYRAVLEIGPGTGALTRHLVKKPDWELSVIEIDPAAVELLRKDPHLKGLHILVGDILALDLNRLYPGPFALIGNLPYNISSPVFFRLLEHRHHVPEAVFMIQKEVAKRIAAAPGNKTYGILSVLLQAYYRVELLFTVPPGVFSPPPKVESAVIRLWRNTTERLECDESLFVRLVKQGFQNRRKTLRNALKPINLPAEMAADPILSKRAEQLSVQDFVELAQRAEHLWRRTSHSN